VAQGVPLIVLKGKSSDAAEVKKKEIPGSTSGKNKKTSFAALIQEAADGLSGDKKTIKGKSGEAALLKLISGILKTIRDKLPAPLKKNFLNLADAIIRKTGFSEKEKKDLLASLLKKIQKKGRFPASLADEIEALAVSLSRDTRDISQKQMLLAAIRDLMNEKTGKEKSNPAHNSVSKLVVIDLRKGKSAKQEAQTGDKSAGITGNSENGGNTLKVNAHEGTRDNVLYFSLKDGESGRESAPDPGTVTRGQAGFDQHMMEKLKNSLQSEIVKHTKLILKENGNGEIRIVLKPESLGNIRMRVHLQNNHIDGRIFVENNNIKEIVDQAMNNLNAAFKQEGFDSISLRVSVGHGNEQDRHEHGDEQEKAAEYSYADAKEEFEKNLELLFDTGMDYSRVNLFV
jgi:flagellar hook-length control protein FliK